MFTPFNMQKQQYLTHPVLCCNASIHLLSVCSIQVPISLRQPPPPQSSVCSDWSALTGLSRHHSSHFYISSGDVFCNHACVGGVADGGDCTVVTSKPYRSPDSSFEGTVSEYVLYVLLSGLSILIL